MNARLQAAAPQPSDLSPADAFAAWMRHGHPGDARAYHHRLVAVGRDPVVSTLRLLISAGAGAGMPVSEALQQANGTEP
jgi:hypothetical protein